MLQKFNDRIADCLARATDAERRAAEATNEAVRIDHERMAKHWRHLASSYQFAENPENFLGDVEAAARGAGASHGVYSAL
jgi:hypothetical protein